MNEMQKNFKLDNFVNDTDNELLKNDKYTFAVLRNIVNQECNLLFSNHKDLIICYSRSPFPVWIWTLDNLTNSEKKNVYDIVKEIFPLNNNNSFMMKYELADFFINQAKKENITLSIKLNMFAYECTNPIKPNHVADGSLYHCKEQDIDEMVEFMDLFHKDINADIESLEEYRKQALEGLKQGVYYFWKNNEGKAVACCSLKIRADTYSIGLVYTKEEYRRKYYAQNLVYQVSLISKNSGYNPTLYTDADYSASNSCYEKIGYILRGKLCRIG